MSTPSELLLRQEFSLESLSSTGRYTFVVRVDDSPTVLKYTVTEVRAPSGERVYDYPESVVVDIAAAITELKTHYVPTMLAELVSGPGPLAMAFQAVEGGPDPLPQKLLISNTGSFGSLLYWAAAPTEEWVMSTPETDGGVRKNAATEVAVAVTPADLTAGNHVAAVAFADTNAQGSPQTVNITFTVLPKAEIELSVVSLTFVGQQGGPNPAAQQFTVTNSGPQDSELSFTVDTAELTSWLTIDPTSGTRTSGQAAVITVSADTAGLVAGNYFATIRVTDLTASNSPQTISVILSLT